MSTEPRPTPETDAVAESIEELIKQWKAGNFTSQILTQLIQRELLKIGKLECERDQLRQRIAELEKDRKRYHWLCLQLSSDWMFGEDAVNDYADMDRWEHQGGEDDCSEIRSAWNLAIDDAMKGKQ